MVILQITANVTCPKDVAIVNTSWPVGNNIGKHAFKSNNIFVEVKAWSSSNVFGLCMNFILDVYIFIFFGRSCYSKKSTHLHGCRQLVH